MALGRESRSLFAFLVGLLSLALVFAFVSRRRGEGAVPGGAPILSLAASEKGFLAGTADGLWVSPDGYEWVRHPEFASGRVVVGAEEGVAVAASARALSIIETSQRASIVAKSPANPSAVVPGQGGDVYVATGEGRFYRISDATILPVRGEGGPPEVLALDEDEGTLYAGGLVSGLYRSRDLGDTWTKILATSLTAILVDPDDTRRILIGTAGGVLITEDSGDSWNFSEMRSSISGLSARHGDFFALGDRFLFRSADGDRDWKPVKDSPKARSKTPALGH